MRPDSDMSKIHPAVMKSSVHVERDFLGQFLHPDNLDPCAGKRLAVISTGVRDGRVLDLGCRSEWLSRALASRGLSVIGLDIRDALAVQERGSRFSRRQRGPRALAGYR